VGDKLIVLETMKMETPVVAPQAGTVVAICCTPGTLVRAGQTVVALQPDG
jgi:urea carboxylase